jgi:hypothetical protein
MKAVAILGAGPAGLLAAHAAAICGQPVAILSYGKKSVLGGAQFLHEPIPELTDDEPDVTITYKRSGTAENYQRKAYGMGPQPSFVSFDGVKNGMTQPGWNLRKMYDRLWDLYGGQITETEVSATTLPGILSDSLFSLVISTIPLRSLCRSDERHVAGGHRFTRQSIKILNGACVSGSDDNTIWYDGSRDRSFYRASRLFGVASTEWGLSMADSAPPGVTAGSVTVHKPLENTCDCWPDLIKVGRFGRWQKGVLAHDGFRTTVVAMADKELIYFGDRIRP